MVQEIQSWWQSPYRSEPTIAEMLNDPIVHLVMARDQVRGDDVSSLMHNVAARMRQIENRAA